MWSLILQEARVYFLTEDSHSECRSSKDGSPTVGVLFKPPLKSYLLSHWPESIIRPSQCQGGRWQLETVTTTFVIYGAFLKVKIIVDVLFYSSSNKTFNIATFVTIWRKAKMQIKPYKTAFFLKKVILQRKMLLRRASICWLPGAWHTFSNLIFTESLPASVSLCA